MRINSVNIYSPSFTSCSRTKYKVKETGKEYTHQYYSMDPAYSLMVQGLNPNYSPVKIVNSNYTTFFRDDVKDWNATAKTLSNAFRDTDKVNVYNFACSDGSEPYSLAISLIETLGEEEAKKFFPINALDIDSIILNKAKKGELFCSNKEIKKINKYTSSKMDKYFEKVFDLGESDTIVRVLPILKDNVKFEKANFTEKIKQIDTPNNLILCRNFWRYLPHNKTAGALVALRHLGDNARFMFGDFDSADSCDSTLPYHFAMAGITYDMANVYKINPKIAAKFTDEQIAQSAKKGIYYSE